MNVPVLAVALTIALAQNAVPRILLDQPLVAVEYQLARLSNDDLAASGTQARRCARIGRSTWRSSRAKA